MKKNFMAQRHVQVLDKGKILGANSNDSCDTHINGLVYDGVLSAPDKNVEAQLSCPVSEESKRPSELVRKCNFMS